MGSERYSSVKFDLKTAILPAAPWGWKDRLTACLRKYARRCKRGAAASPACSHGRHKREFSYFLLLSSYPGHTAGQVWDRDLIVNIDSYGFCPVVPLSRKKICLLGARGRWHLFTYDRWLSCQRAIGAAANSRCKTSTVLQ